MCNDMEIGIFEDKNGNLYWLDCMDDEEVSKAKYFVSEHEYYCAGFHMCNKSALYDDVSDYVDDLQDENNLPDNEMYVVCYHTSFVDGGAVNVEGRVDFGITKQEIIDNVKDNKYIEGASYHTVGQMLYTTLESLTYYANN